MSATATRQVTTTVTTTTCTAEMTPNPMVTEGFDVRCARHGFDVRGYAYNHAREAKRAHEDAHALTHEPLATIQASPMLNVTERANRSVVVVMDESDLFPLLRLLTGDTSTRADDLERLAYLTDAIGDHAARD